MKILIGLLLIASGIAILHFRYQIYHFTGDWDWAVRYLGGNGTIVALSLIGMLLIGVGTAYPFGVIDFGPKTEVTRFQINPSR